MVLPSLSRAALLRCKIGQLWIYIQLGQSFQHALTYCAYVLCVLKMKDPFETRIGGYRSYAGVQDRIDTQTDELHQVSVAVRISVRHQQQQLHAASFPTERQHDSCRCTVKIPHVQKSICNARLCFVEKSNFVL